MDWSPDHGKWVVSSDGKVDRSAHFVILVREIRPLVEAVQRFRFVDPPKGIERISSNECHRSNDLPPPPFLLYELLHISFSERTTTHHLNAAQRTSLGVTFVNALTMVS
jgi:hypothetical protein